MSTPRLIVYGRHFYARRHKKITVSIKITVQKIVLLIKGRYYDYMGYKRSQIIMLWLLPVILIGGWFFPAFGLLVLAMIIFFLPLSYYKQRYWCWYLCPRGSFLNIVLPPISLKMNLPKLFSRDWFRWGIFYLLIGFLIFNLLKAGISPVLIGAAFWLMCMLTTGIAIILGLIFKPRSWCVVCPMGTLQEEIGKWGSPRRE